MISTRGFNTRLYSDTHYKSLSCALKLQYNVLFAVIFCDILLVLQKRRLLGFVSISAAIKRGRNETLDSPQNTWGTIC